VRLLTYQKINHNPSFIIINANDLISTKATLDIITEDEYTKGS